MTEIERSYPKIPTVEELKKEEEQAAEYNGHVQMDTSNCDISSHSSGQNMDITETPDITNKMRHYGTKIINANKNPGESKQPNI